MDRHSQRLAGFLRVRSLRAVILLTLALSALCVAVPVCSVLILLTSTPWIPPRLFAAALGIAAAIPLLIAPPIAFIGLNMLRLLTLTIDTVDEHVRFDTLTGALSRGYFLATAQKMLETGGAFFMIDADHFKAINDNHGHDIGDEALKLVATTLRRASPVGALVGRLGGEEFGVVLRCVDEAVVVRIAQELCVAMREDGAVVAGVPLKLTFSVGIAVRHGEESLPALMKRADKALYHAKRSGRDRCYLIGATDTMPALLLQARKARA